nr:hypothetical protein BaRGS_033003 [Batillaria attramentaria]
MRARFRDNWEDEDEEEKKDEAKTETQAYQRPKKKSLAERIAEKEAQQKKEEEEKKKAEKKDLTPEERLAEKIRIKKMQEQESLSLAKGLFGVSESSIDNMIPATEEEFTQFEEALKSKITFFEESKFYPAFVEKLIADLVLGLGVEDVKKIGISLNNLYHEKERQRKEQEKKKKKKSKVSLKVDRADDLDLIGDVAGGGGYAYDDDEFI